MILVRSVNGSLLGPGSQGGQLRRSVDRRAAYLRRFGNRFLDQLCSLGAVIFICPGFLGDCFVVRCSSH